MNYPTREIYRPSAVLPRRLLVILACVLVIGWINPGWCRAQDDASFIDRKQIEDMAQRIPVERPTVRPAEIDEIARYFGFDQDVRGLLDSLHKGYVEQFTAAATTRQEKLRDYMKKVADFQDLDPVSNPEAMQDFMDQARQMNDYETKWRADKKRMNEAFYANVQALLNEQQLALWPRYQCDHRRRETLHVGAFFCGEGVDLVRLVDDLQLESAARAQVEPTLDTYVSALDVKLQKRMETQAKIRDFNEEMLDQDPMNQDPNEAMQRYTDMLQAMRDVVRQRMEIRDVNVQYQQIIASSIPSASARDFNRQWDRECHPTIYKPTPAQTYIENLLEREDIEPDQSDGLKAALDAHDLNVDSVNGQLARIETDIEKSLKEIMDKDANGMISMMIGSFSAVDDESAMQMMDFDAKSTFTSDDQETRRDELLLAKRQFARAAVQQAFGMLTQAQQAEAPMPEIADNEPGEEFRKQTRQRIRQVLTMIEQMGGMDF